MKILLNSALVLGTAFAVGASQPVNAAATQPIAPAGQQDNLILARDGHRGHHGGRHGGYGRHGGHHGGYGRHGGRHGYGYGSGYGYGGYYVAPGYGSGYLGAPGYNYCGWVNGIYICR